MISKFFLKRPVFAIVASIFITLSGLICLKSLPIEQYPSMTPPMILVTTRFPGATAQTLANTVAAPLEQAINGTEHMIYMYSQSAAPGNLSLRVFFDIGTDPDVALTHTQNRVNRALSSLPQEVQQEGVTVTKQFPSFLLFIAIEAKGGVYDDIFVANYANIHIADELERIKGVSRATVMNARDYSMRIWLKPDRMAQLGLTTSDVIQAIQTQSADRSIGEIGQEPTSSPLELTIPVNSSGQFKEPSQFENVILRANADGSMILLKDIGSVDLGSKSYDLVGKLNGKAGAMIAINQDSGANALDVAARIRNKMQELMPFFPPGLEYSIPYDTTNYIKLSIHEVITTLFIAAVLVSLVILLFLHSFKATLVPVVAMLVSIMGTFCGMYFLGFSLNTLSLFGMVLAIGIVVDDAIVVVENIERNIKAGLSPFEAATKTMNEVTGPVIAIVLVLCAVFIPVAFIGGIPGIFYKQFAMTIAVSVVISGFVALTLSPVLSVILLKHSHEPSQFGVRFNHYFEIVNQSYLRYLKWLLPKKHFALGICSLLIFLLVLLFRSTPLGFVPVEDQGVLMISAALPDGSSLSRVEAVTNQIEKIVKKTDGVQDVLTFSGYSLLDSIQRTPMGTYFLSLEDWSQRKSKKLSAAGILNTLQSELESIPEAQVKIFNPPDIPGIGVVGGFDFWILNQGDASMNELNNIVDKIVSKAKENSLYKFFITSIQANCLELFLDLDVIKARSLGVSVADVYQSLQVLLGSVFVNNFTKFGRVFQVVCQAESSYRDDVTDIGDIYVRSQTTNQMVPLKSILIPRFTSSPTLVTRYNDNPAALISVVPATINANAVMSTMEDIAKEFLPPGMSYSWGGLAYQVKTSGGPSPLPLLGGFLMVFLILAALYERWSLPLVILLAVPFGIFGAILSIWLRGMSNDIYFQVGLVTLIGLAAKNAILIVEFARAKRDAGMGVTEAALEAANLRFRAILMTSLTFIFGVLPLVMSSGAGAASRHSVGTGVLGGMFIATLCGVFFIPFFYQLLETFLENRRK